MTFDFCLHCAGNDRSASVLHPRGYRIHHYRYLCLCSYETERYSEGEVSLLGSSWATPVLSRLPNDSKANPVTSPPEAPLNRMAASAGYQLLGRICRRASGGGRKEQAAHYFGKSLEFNGFTWSAYETMCQLGVESVISSSASASASTAASTVSSTAADIKGLNELSHSHIPTNPFTAQALYVWLHISLSFTLILISRLHPCVCVDMTDARSDLWCRFLHIRWLLPHQRWYLQPQPSHRRINRRFLLIQLPSGRVAVRTMLLRYRPPRLLNHSSVLPPPLLTLRHYFNLPVSPT